VAPDLLATNAALVQDVGIRMVYSERNSQEFNRTQRMLELVFNGGSVASRRSRLVRIVQLRDA